MQKRYFCSWCYGWFVQTQLQAFFPYRDEENIILLTAAAETELGAKDFDSIDYKSLFMEVLYTAANLPTSEFSLKTLRMIIIIHLISNWWCCRLQDDEGKTGPFLDEFRTQLRNDRHAFVEEIRKQLGTTS